MEWPRRSWQGETVDYLTVSSYYPTSYFLPAHTRLHGAHRLLDDPSASASASAGVLCSLLFASFDVMSGSCAFLVLRHQSWQDLLASGKKQEVRRSSLPKVEGRVQMKWSASITPSCPPFSATYLSRVSAGKTSSRSLGACA